MQESPIVPEGQKTSQGLVLFGGVFDPVHNGHLRVAEVARSSLGVERVVFLPAGNPPHKGGDVVTPGHHRLAMLEQAIAASDSFVVDTRELEREGPSYTVLTLRELRTELPESTCYFLIGADNARTIGGWHRAEELFDLCSPVLVPRPGHIARFEASDLPFVSTERLTQLNSVALSMDPVDLSSSEVRRRAESGTPIRDVVPPAVADYIETHHLYRTTKA